MKNTYIILKLNLDQDRRCSILESQLFHKHKHGHKQKKKQK